MTNGDFLISWAATLGAFWWTREDAVLNQHIFKVESFIDQRFHFYLVSHILSDLQRQAHGSGMVHITKGSFDSAVVPIPPLGEQRRIVAAIEEHLSRLDSGITSLKRGLALLPRYRQATLAAALNGRLLSLGGSSGWQYKALSELATIASGNTPKGIDDIARETGAIPWFRISDMNSEGNERELRTARCYLGEEDVERLHLRLFPTGSIVFPKRGGAINTNKKRVLGQPSALDLNTMGITVPATMQPWIRVWFESIELKSLSDGSNVPQINHDDIKPLIVPLPPAEQRKKLVEEWAQREDSYRQIETEINSGLIRGAGLRQSIMMRALDGKLVPQDPRDEPGSVLLDRIRASCKTAPAKTKKSRKSA